MSWFSKALGLDKKVSTQTQALDPASQRYVDQMRMQAQQGANVALQGPGGSQPFQMGGWQGKYSSGGPGGAPGGNSWFTGPQTMSVGDQAAQFMNPYMQQVIGGVRGEFDHLRNQSAMGSNQEATLGGAFGGSRHAIMQGARLGELDRAQTSQIGGLLAGGYQNALQQGTAYQEHQRQLQQQRLQEPLFRQQQAQAFQQGGMGPTGWTSTQTQPGGSPLGTAAGIAATLYGSGMFGGGQQGGMQVGGQVPQGYQSAPNYTMPQPWQAPQWNPQYRGPYG